MMHGLYSSGIAIGGAPNLTKRLKPFQEISMKASHRSAYFNIGACSPKTACVLFAYSYYIVVHIFISNNISGSAVSNWTINDKVPVVFSTFGTSSCGFDTLLYCTIIIRTR